MNITKCILLWLALSFACFLPSSALTLTTPENRIWEIFSIGYDAPTAEATDLGSRTETSTSNYDTAPIHRAITEEIPTEANRSLFGQITEFKAAEGAERGYVSGYSQIMERAQAGAAGDIQAQSEIDVAKILRSEGQNVRFQTPIGHRGAGTADFLVGGETGTGVGGVATDVILQSVHLPVISFLV